MFIVLDFLVIFMDFLVIFLDCLVIFLDVLFIFLDDLVIFLDFLVIFLHVLVIFRQSRREAGSPITANALEKFEAVRLFGRSGNMSFCTCPCSALPCHAQSCKTLDPQGNIESVDERGRKQVVHYIVLNRIFLVRGWLGLVRDWFGQCGRPNRVEF